jgi:hypothetical protein
MKWGTGNPSSTDLYRDRTAASVPPISLRRKRCDCGKVVTAKQLQQYGACGSCVRAAADNDIKEAA